ncbi:MerR family transcriptional regulator [Streptomyces sp. NPDC004376]
MNGDRLYSIGDLARRTGLTVKTIRFYSDRGIVSPTARSPAGYRLYDTEAAARLDLIQTLRALGLDLATIRKVVERELSLPEVAAAHADALAVQIKTLRLRRAVLMAVAKRGQSHEESDLMHKLARISEDERRRLTGDFLDSVFGGLEASPGFAGIRRSMTPELPDDPDAGQLQAWVELAELCQEPDFRACVRRMAEDLASDRSIGNRTVLRQDISTAARDLAGPALVSGIEPTSPQADPIVATLTAQYADLLGHPDDVELRRRLLARLETVNDSRLDEYTVLLAVINSWAVPDPLGPALDWFVQALRARDTDSEPGILGHVL